jgi:hypothetical protein
MRLPTQPFVRDHEIRDLIEQLDSALDVLLAERKVSGEATLKEDQVALVAWATAAAADLLVELRLAQPV